MSHLIEIYTVCKIIYFRYWLIVAMFSGGAQTDVTWLSIELSSESGKLSHIRTGFVVFSNTPVHFSTADSNLNPNRHLFSNFMINIQINVGNKFKI